jgi:hypothetical protein
MIVRFSPSRFLLLSSSPPPSLPLFSSLRSWHNEETGWLSIRSLSLPCLWLLYVRSVSTTDKLERLGLL